MPRAFLIKSRAACPAPKKESTESTNGFNDENAQPMPQVTSSFQQDSTSVDRMTSIQSQISPSYQMIKKPNPFETTAERVRENNSVQKPAQAPTDLLRYSSHNTAEVSRVRKRPSKRCQQYTEESEEQHKKIRKGQPKKSVVYYYENEITKQQDDAQKSPTRKDESRFENYTDDRRLYVNEAGRYQNHELTSQSREKSTGKLYSESHGKHATSLAYQNTGEPLNQRKPPAAQRYTENNKLPEKSSGLENVMIVEYHSVKSNRRNSFDSNVARPDVTQRSSQGYYSQSQNSPVVTSNYASPVTTSSAPLQIPQQPRVSAQPMPRQENTKTTEEEPKVVYVPVYPVSQGPNGVIYEPIPNATPIMAKDTLPVQKVQPPPPPQQIQEHPRVVQAVAPQRQEAALTSPPPQPERKPRMEYRAYEPQMPQQLTAAPAPQTYQPHPQGHMIIQQPQSAPATPTTYAVAHAPQYAVRPGPQPQPPQHQYQQPQQSHPSQQQRYQAHQPSASAPQQVIYRPAVPQTYQEQPRHYYPRPAAMPGFQERVVAQPTAPRPPVSMQQPIYHHPEQASHNQQQSRPPPLPSQPQHAEKPALPSPSYPQESANRRMTPRYTPDGVKHEPKFVYAPPPADFMHSPVYRVPPTSNSDTVPIYQHEKAEPNHNRTGSRKRKTSYPSYSNLQSQTEHQSHLRNSSECNSRTPSPKETDLRCNERLVKSPHQPSPLNKSSLVMTPPVSPNDRAENDDTVTVVVRDQGIQASPRVDSGTLEHTCFRKTASHIRSNSYQSDSSEEDFIEDDSDKRGNSEPPRSPDDMYTEDGTLVVHIPHTDHNNNNNGNHLKKQRGKKGNYRFLCKYCNKGFQWHSHLESHERTHTGVKPFKCPECDRAFCRADGLQCHMLVHNKKRPYKCPHCGKGFTDKIVLEKHIYSHTGVKPFKCEYCGRAFSDSLSIEKHLLVHTGTKPYKCPYCVRSFNDSQMLVRHIRSHTGEKPFKCKHCPMAFSKQSALIIHTRVHTGEKPYKCPHCVKSFSISGNLQRHILIHTGERPYKCSKCPKAFNNPSHLSRHISKLHAPQNGTAKEQVKYEHYQQEQYDRQQPVM